MNSYVKCTTSEIDDPRAQLSPLRLEATLGKEADEPTMPTADLENTRWRGHVFKDFVQPEETTTRQIGTSPFFDLWQIAFSLILVPVPSPIEVLRVVGHDEVAGF